MGKTIAMKNLGQIMLLLMLKSEWENPGQHIIFFSCIYETQLVVTKQQMLSISRDVNLSFVFIAALTFRLWDLRGDSKANVFII